MLQFNLVMASIKKAVKYISVSVGKSKFDILEGKKCPVNKNSVY